MVNTSTNEFKDRYVSETTGNSSDAETYQLVEQVLMIIKKLFIIEL